MLKITIHPNALRIDLDAVLTEDHPKYIKPSESEQYCYNRMSIDFAEVYAIEKINIQFSLSTDASGEADMGSIDFFEVIGDSVFHLIGAWGEIRIRAKSVSTSLDSSENCRI